jgi:hypothetical protein
VKGTANILDAKTPGYDDVARAGALATLKSVRSKLGKAAGGNEETKAHRANLVFLIDKALKAD